jgi:hypothetical protein
MFAPRIAEADNEFLSRSNNRRAVKTILLKKGGSHKNERPMIGHVMAREVTVR